MPYSFALRSFNCERWIVHQTKTFVYSLFAAYITIGDGVPDLIYIPNHKPIINPSKITPQPQIFAQYCQRSDDTLEWIFSARILLIYLSVESHILDVYSGINHCNLCMFLNFVSIRYCIILFFRIYPDCRTRGSH